MKQHPITPHIPFFAQPGCKTERTWEADFEDRRGNRAILTLIEYRDKKNALHQAVIRVKWETLSK